MSVLSDTRSHTRSMRYVFGRRARALCSRELGRSSAPRGSGPAAAEAVERLSLRRSAADESELRGKMYCLLHLLIQQEMLCWLMVCG